MLSSGSHCPMWTVPLVLVRRTASPEHADFGGLSSLDALIVVRLVVVPLPPQVSNSSDLLQSNQGSQRMGHNKP
jgi:hypothetical protein